MAPAYTFRPLSTADLPLIRQWLGEAHVREWWGDPEEQLALVSGDLTEPAMDQFIVLAGSRPFGYLQCYRLTAWNTGFGPQPEGTRGIDQFIGDSDMIGRGHGSALIRQFVDECFRQGLPRMVTDPDPLNVRALRAYEKAGFVRLRLVETPDGAASLMVREP
ncbi:aminoglycoside adenylyltransferase [Bradyrhizobium sacchari]|uniref:Aminoglycoside 6'-N-acetyltransferase n=1 Tax=Bradyrhizobium sacchari TaxID=1399419 RepID=A0A560KEA1_9BRAD|nr:GNAT family N-acetyltransferase [Bradyrhizobium sacchari]OPZ00848.1 aminoglycoside adenylyltransferase [Bradyrhizobium sacchari]TWB65352.1 aminoglycoside 6'-N-acetyltransferase [Bradyrhizobium sacchari]TWB81675.1 aminoglycoside 6'-N-acetyltransferase [Bradyrhizobium sacchari]